MSVDALPTLPNRVRAALDTTELGSSEPLLVAVSGGVDSLVLLHCLRFAPWLDAPLTVVHLDHAMRPESASDALWLRGVCRAWDVPIEQRRLDTAPRSEAEARDARYAFFEALRDEIGGTVMTAHHADDQAETVLFRALRGTTVAGLAGVPAHRPGVVRPLLDCWRTEIVDYARRHGLVWREDVTNRSDRYARNVLRRRILPTAERHVAPTPRRALVRLSESARSNEEAWEEAFPALLASVDGTLSPIPSVCADTFLGLGRSLQERLLRLIALHLGHRLEASAVARGLEHAAGARSGSAAQIGRGLEIRRELDRLVVTHTATIEADQSLEIPDVGPGEGALLLSGTKLHVSWRLASDPEPHCADSKASAGEMVGRFNVSDLVFPLRLRGHLPGDRLRTSAGTKKVKKVFLEARVPPTLRRSSPVLANGAGEVLWLPAVRPSLAPPAVGPTFTVRLGP